MHSNLFDKPYIFRYDSPIPFPFLSFSFFSIFQFLVLLPSSSSSSFPPSHTHSHLSHLLANYLSIQVDAHSNNTSSPASSSSSFFSSPSLAPLHFSSLPFFPFIFTFSPFFSLSFSSSSLLSLLLFPLPPSLSNTASHSIHSLFSPSLSLFSSFPFSSSLSYILFISSIFNSSLILYIPILSSSLLSWQSSLFLFDLHFLSFPLFIFHSLFSSLFPPSHFPFPSPIPFYSSSLHLFSPFLSLLFSSPSPSIPHHPLPSLP